MYNMTITLDIPSATYIVSSGRVEYLVNEFIKKYSSKTKKPKK